MNSIQRRCARRCKALSVGTRYGGVGAAGGEEGLRQRRAWRSIPIIVFTAEDLTADDRLQLYGSVQKTFQKGGIGARPCCPRFVSW
jgi:hypothetical protein